MTGALLANIDEVPPGVWAAACPAPAYTTREWLAASRWPGDGSRYLLADDLVMPARTVHDPVAWSRMNLVDICAGTAFGAWADARAVADARAEAVPHLLVAAPGYFTVPIGPPDGDLVALVDAAEDQGLPVGFAYLPPQAELLLDVLRRRGYVAGVVSATTRLDLPGDTFDDYLGCLTSRRRGQVRREMRRFAEAGGTVDHAVGADAAGWLGLVAQLESALQQAHGFTASDNLYLALNRRFLDQFGPSMHLLRASLHGEPVATVTLLHTGGEMVVRAFGACDHPEVRAAMVYFNLVYYASIGLAQRLGVRRMWFGTSTVDTKRWRGLTVVPLRAAIGPRGGRLRPLLTVTDEHLRQMLDRWHAA
jgi:hypothetical protein